MRQSCQTEPGEPLAFLFSSVGRLAASGALSGSASFRPGWSDSLSFSEGAAASDPEPSPADAGVVEVGVADEAEDGIVDEGCSAEDAAGSWATVAPLLASPAAPFRLEKHTQKQTGTNTRQRILLSLSK